MTDRVLDLQFYEEGHFENERMDALRKTIQKNGLFWSKV